MIDLKSKSLIDYYTNNPDDYTIKYHHYNIIVSNDSNDEYKNIEEDINSFRKINQDNSIIYFSDLKNFKKINNNTDILKNSKDVYLRIRNNEEYNNFKLLDTNINLIIELKDLETIDIKDENITIQIDNICELSQESLNDLKIKYNISKILVGQMMYITNDYFYLLEILSKQFNININNQLELEKNNEVTNDIYDIETYIKILDKIDDIINKCKSDDVIKTINNIFDYIANNVSYDDTGVLNTNIESQNLIGPIFNKKSVCEGYSKLYKQILSLIGVESIIVSGGGSKVDGGHVWNQVKINNVWYNTDVTAQSYAIHNNENFNMFLVNDEKCKYKSTSPFAHKCEVDYNEEKND